MLDIKFIRENPELVQEAARKKRLDFDVSRFLQIDKERSALLRDLEDLRAKQNSASEKIAHIKDRQEKEIQIKASKELKQVISEKETAFRELDEQWKKLMLEVPNIPDPSVPEGGSEEDNQEIRKWGRIPEFDFPVKDHLTLMKDLDLIDLERGAKVSGFRGYFLKNEAALLSLALWQFVADFLKNKGFKIFIAPSLVRADGFIGTGWLPQGKDEIYKVEDDLYLSGTAEVPMMAYHQNEILTEQDLPKKYAAFSPCFRREAGSYGKDTKGLFRLHEFAKAEQVVLCAASHEESVKWHEELTKNSEEIMQALQIPYRVVLNCGADLGLGQVKKYDVEAWVPSEKKYRETHSASYFHDFQTRRLNIRYRDRKGEIEFAHSLNNTAIATPRILIALLENYQQKDGRVLIPEALQKYIGKKEIDYGKRAV